MAYNLSMELNLQGPSSGNIAAIKKRIEGGLSNIRVGNIDTKNFAKATSQVGKLSQTMKKGEAQAKTFFDKVEGKGRDFAAYTVASTALIKLTSGIANATREAIKFEAELLKITQVTGRGVGALGEFGSALTKISKTYNITLSQTAKLTRTLTQTGLSFQQAARGAELLARTSLLATFDSLQSTTEGLIATMQTFETTVSRAGSVLETINAISKRFAVESGDIVEAIRRTGGAFRSAGGDVEELIALFTAVRSTSRESAETIATGFRTIFGRLQRPKTIEYFKELGVQLETAEGQFIGPYQAIQQISEALERLGIRAGSTRFAEVVEQIGGIRQISKVTPLLMEFGKAQRAMAIANEGAIESIEDLEKAQSGLGYQLGTLQKEFGALISEIVNSASFKFLADVFINTSKAVIGLVSALKPLMPFLAAIAAFKIGSGLTKLLSGKLNLGKSLGMNAGGLVPGVGNRDTVPAMLTPGEFVIRKSSVNKLGASRLAAMNKYAYGGTVQNASQFMDYGITVQDLKDKRKGIPKAIGNAARGSLLGNMFESFLYENYGITSQTQKFPDAAGLNLKENASMAKRIERATGPLRKGVKNVEFKYKKDLEKTAKYAGKYTPENTDIYSAFAAGGPVGTDTVPALLTPGEFVINRSSAQKIGYSSLNRMNKVGKYAAGGKVQRFQNGGNVDAMTELAAEGRNQQTLQNTIQELAMSIKAAKEELDVLGDTLYPEQAKALKENIKQMQVAKDNTQALARASKERQEELKKQAFKGGTPSTEDKSDKAIKKVAKERVTAEKKAVESVQGLGASFIGLAFQAQGVASGLKAFGFEINQGALTQGQVKGGMFAGAADLVSMAGDKRTVQGLGKAAQKLPGKFGKIGKTITRASGTIAKGARVAAKGLNALALIELGGGLFDAIFSTDYSKQRDNFIELGDAAAAGVAAQRAYNQEFLRSVPIIGGFLSGLADMTGLIDMLPQSGVGAAAVENAKLAASIKGVDKQVRKATQSFKEAAAVNDVSGLRDAVGAQLDIVDNLNAQADATAAAADRAQGTKKWTAAGRTGMGIGGGIAAGAGIGAVVGGVLGAIGGPLAAITSGMGAVIGGAIGGIVGGVTSLWSAITGANKVIAQGYELQAESIRKGTEVQVEVIGSINNMITSETKRLVRAGGTYADAVASITERVGAENIERAMGGFQLSGDAEKDADVLQKTVTARQEEIQSLRVQQAGLKESERTRKAELEVQIASAERTRDVAEETRKGVVAARAMEIQENKLRRLREIHAARIAEQIKLQRILNKTFDDLNNSLIRINIAADDASAAGAGEMSQRQVFDTLGTGMDFATFQMDTDAITRSEDAMLEFANGVGALSGKLKEEIVAAAVRVRQLKEIEKLGKDRIEELLRTEGVDEETLKDADPKDIKSGIENFTQALADEIGVSLEGNPIMKDILKDFSESLIQGGVEGRAGGVQKAIDDATQTAQKIIDKYKNTIEEVNSKLLQLEQMKAERANKLAEIAKKTYDAEKEYYEQRMDLIRSNREFFDDEDFGQGPGGAQRMERRRVRRTSQDMEALNERRRNRFADLGIGRQTEDGDTQYAKTTADALKILSEETERGTAAQAEFTNQVEAVIDGIQDEISIRKTNLQGMKDEANARRDYQQALNDAQGDIVMDLVTGTDEEVAGMMEGMNAAAFASVQGSFAGIPEDMKKQAMGYLDAFSDVEIPGLGKTGRQAQRDIVKGEMMRKFGVDEATAERLADKAVKKRVPIEERYKEMIDEEERRILALYDQERQAKQLLIDQDKQNYEKFDAAVQNFEAAVNKLAAKLKADMDAETTSEDLDRKQEEEKQKAEQNKTKRVEEEKKKAADQKQKEEQRIADDDTQRDPGTLPAPYEGPLSPTTRGLIGKRTLFRRGAISTPEGLTEEDMERGLERQILQSMGYRGGRGGTSAEKKAEMLRQIEEYENRDKNVAAAAPTKDFVKGELVRKFGVDEASAERLADKAVQAPAPPTAPTQAPAPARPRRNDVAGPITKGIEAARDMEQRIRHDVEGSNEMTLRIPQFENLVNRELHAQMSNFIGETFVSLAEDIRTAQNFDDVANVFADQAENTTNAGDTE